MNEEILNAENLFENKKYYFFNKIAIQLKDAFKIHKMNRLWQRNQQGMKDWRNVSEHCLVEVARVQALADMIGLPSHIVDMLRLSAALHDANKRLEIDAIREAEIKGIPILPAIVAVGAGKVKQLHQAGFSDEVAHIAEVAGASPNELLTAQAILEKKDDLTDVDVAMLIMQYVDGYTRGSTWVELAGIDAKGNAVNDVDRRLEQNRSNPAYKKIQVEQTAGLAGHPSFQGKNVNEVAVQVWHEIERRLCELIRVHTGNAIDPIALPEIVDQKIKHTIETI